MDNGLRRAERVAAAKLASLLRIADALDASRRQKISQIRVSLRSQQLTITATSQDNVDLERWSFNTRSRFFESVFGVPVKFKWRKVQ
jgi:exopolyphosphatase/guanosine-5'-triphosphate,3'-diphosphate pyrophosphatase